MSTDSQTKLYADWIEQRAERIYPHDLWPPVSSEEWASVRAALEGSGITLDRIGADLMRRGIRGTAMDLLDGYMEDDE